MTPARTPGTPRFAQEAAVLVFFAAATLALTWPLSATPGEAVSVRGDYYSNLWNAWWMRTALFELGTSPFWTDYLHHPLGVSLARHTLSPLNSISGALLGRFLDAHDAFKVLLLVHFWLSGYCFFLFAREVSGDFAGSVLAGLLWSFCPFHFYYMAQINAATMECLPLAGLFLVKTYREPRWGSGLGLALSAALLAASFYYYLVYAALLGALLLVGGPLWDRTTPFRSAAPRLIAAGLGAGVAAALVAWPILREGVQAEAPEHLVARSNDLLGFNWVGYPERVIVSWPTMLGYSTFGLLALGLRRDRRQLFWLALAVAFGVLSLGPVLHVHRNATGVELPGGWLAELPYLSMLRKPDRFMVMVQLCVALLAAFAWRGVAQRLSSGLGRRALWVGVAAVAVLERAAIPLETFRVSVSPYFAELEQSDDVRALVELPLFGGAPADARSNFHQTIHGKKIVQGYVTNLALTPAHLEAAALWREAQEQLLEGRVEALALRVAETDVDLVVCHKRVPGLRRPMAIDGQTVWRPFFLVRRPLVGISQRGHLVERPLPRSTLEIEKSALSRAFGEAEFEDDSIVAFRCDHPGETRPP